MTTNPCGRRVVFHADDFGMSPGVNRGILRGFREGLLTSTSVLVNAPAAEAAINEWERLAYDREQGTLPSGLIRESLDEPDQPFELGLHVSLTQGRPLTNDFPVALRSRDGEFLSIGRLYGALALSGGRFHAALVREIRAQMRWLNDRGIEFTHVNGHQYVEMIPAVTRAMCEALLDSPCRHVRLPCEHGRSLLARIKATHAARYSAIMRQNGFTGVAQYRGAMHAGRITLETLQHWLAALPAGSALEIGCHPGESTDGPVNRAWRDSIANGRPAELEWLISPELPQLLMAQSIRLGRIHAADNRAIRRELCIPLSA